MTDLNDLKEKKIVITGATLGFGLELAKGFLHCGAHVAICGRTSKTLETALKALQEDKNTRNTIFGHVADVSNQKSIDQFFDRVFEKFKSIDGLVCNAGIYGPLGPVEQNSWDEWRTALEINLFGTVMCCRTVIPHFKEKRNGKIIILSGGGATRPMPNLSAYASSKAAVVRFAETIAEELKDYGIDVNCIAPGALQTRLTDQIVSAGPDIVGKDFFEATRRIQTEGGSPMEKGVELALFLASTKSSGVTGKLISAVWDQWEKLPSHKDVLNSSDIYTLRRIIPKDRNQDWD